MIKVADIAKVIEDFAPRSLQEDYDNSGLQLGSPEMPVSSALLCLSVTEDIVDEARQRGCNLIVSHHPLFFKSIKRLSDTTSIERIAVKAIKNGIAIYSAHTNLDSTNGGISYEMAHALRMDNVKPLIPNTNDKRCGLGIIGDIPAMPALEFLRHLKELFNVKNLRYSSRTPKIVIRKVALCGGSGAPFISDAIAANADAYVCGDIKYHDFDAFGPDILLTDIGHFESELASKKIFNRIIKEKFPNFVTYFAETEKNPVGTI
jgi:dinuclear metal center YbgI/SA1388 family protein